LDCDIVESTGNSQTKQSLKKNTLKQIGRCRNVTTHSTS